ncbi:thioesterase II family protein [Kordia jejudonensis]|uniref:thioesterase II family protein n=1 Tax=Kordia jejudonensis TaxID=1348245 RepID=UPI0006295B8D|nr:thioesterase domain-containing protein [Kordia jejudonensis]
MINLFCFPFAGGSAYAFASWKKDLPKNVNLKFTELAGRGTRIGEPLYKSMEEAIDDLYSKISNDLGERFAFFGHSLGALLTYELAVKCYTEKGRIPEHLFLSGRGFPSTKKDDFVHDLPDEEFKNTLLHLEGTPKEVFQNEELSKIFLPIIRSDYKLDECYIPKQNMSQSVHTDISVLNGITDEFTKEEMQNWATITNKKCTVKNFDGGHFFINEKKEDVLNYINQTLEALTT